MEIDRQKSLKEDIEDKVSSAYESWSKDPSNSGLCIALNHALSQASMFGVNISVKITQKALTSPESVNQNEFARLKWLNHDLKDEVILKTDRDIRSNLNFILYSGRVFSEIDTGHLDLTAWIEYGITIKFAELKPEDIASFEPIKKQEG